MPYGHILNPDVSNLPFETRTDQFIHHTTLGPVVAREVQAMAKGPKQDVRVYHTGYWEPDADYEKGVQLVGRLEESLRRQWSLPKLPPDTLLRQGLVYVETYLRASIGTREEYDAKRAMFNLEPKQHLVPFMVCITRFGEMEPEKDSPFMRISDESVLTDLVIGEPHYEKAVYLAVDFRGSEPDVLPAKLAVYWNKRPVGVKQNPEWQHGTLTIWCNSLDFVNFHNPPKFKQAQ